MSVYRLIPSHYVQLHSDKPPAPPCSLQQFENLQLLLRTSNAKLAGLAATIKDLRGQLRERDATIAALTASTVAVRTSTVVDNHVEVNSRRAAEPRDVVVDVTSDMQVRLKVELVEQPAGPPLIKVASTVVTRRPANPPAAAAAPEAKQQADAATATAADVPGGGRYAAAPGPGPVRGGHVGGVHLGASPLYASLMWRTRQRARELGYRFVWSRYGKILVKKDVQSPSLYILDEADLRKMA